MGRMKPAAVSDRLTPQECRALVCRCFEEMTTRETAARMGVHASTVRNWGTSALRKLGVRSINGACVTLTRRAERAKR